jgi:hypothetical protein
MIKKGLWGFISLILFVFCGVSRASVKPRPTPSPPSVLEMDQIVSDGLICDVVYRDQIVLAWNSQSVFAVLTSKNKIGYYYKSKSPSGPQFLFSVLGLKLFKYENSDQKESFISIYLMLNRERGTLVMDGQYFEVYNCFPLFAHGTLYSKKRNHIDKSNLSTNE